jgi:hypothetical protein
MLFEFRNIYLNVLNRAFERNEEIYTTSNSLCGNEQISALNNALNSNKEIYTFKRRMLASGMLCLLAVVRNDVSVQRTASIIRTTRIGELGQILAATSNRSKRTTVFYLYFFWPTQNFITIKTS